MQLTCRWLVFTSRAEPHWPVEGLRTLATPAALPEPPRGIHAWEWAGLLPLDPLPEGPLFLRQVDQDPDALQELLRVVPATSLRGLDLKPGTSLEGLGALPLEELALDYWPLGAELHPELHRLQGLRWLSLVETKGATKVYRELLAPLRQLEALNLRDRSLSAALIEAVGKALPGLRALSLSNLNLSGAAVSALASLRTLERLDFYCAGFKEGQLGGLDELPLRSLGFRGLDLSGPSVVAWLERLAPTLEALEFPLCAETAPALEALSAAPALSYLSCFPAFKPDQPRIPPLPCLPERLRWLGVPVEALAESPQLLSQLPELERVRLTGGRFAPEGAVQATFEALPRGLRGLSLSGQPVSFGVLRDFPRLEALACEGLSAASWPELELPGLRHLGLRACAVEAADLARLQAEELRSLDLSVSGLKDLSPLAAFPRLAALCLPGQVVEPGLEPLGELRGSLRWVEPSSLGTRLEPRDAAPPAAGLAGLLGALRGPAGSTRLDPWAGLESLGLQVVGPSGATRRDLGPGARPGAGS